jgi:hypothetical protein
VDIRAPFLGISPGAAPVQDYRYKYIYPLFCREIQELAVFLPWMNKKTGE